MSGKAIDETGNRYGSLVVIERSENSSGQVAWSCLCDCGNTIDVYGYNLRRGCKSSCGCQGRGWATIKDEVGKEYGKLTVVNFSGIDSAGAARWMCRCKCGNVAEVSGRSLRAGNTKSCGCLTTGRHTLCETGKVYGKLTVVERAGLVHRFAAWRCRCECGSETIVSGLSLRQGHTTSCGCNRAMIDETGNMYGKLRVLNPTTKSNDGQTYWACVCECGRIVSIRASSLRSGLAKSCGCHRLIDYGDNRFRSKSEVFLSIALDAMGISWSYEATKIPVLIKGRQRVYIPDFQIHPLGRFLEFKGRRFFSGYDSLSKFYAARSAGHDVLLIKEADLENLCGLRYWRMAKVFNVDRESCVEMIKDSVLAAKAEMRDEWFGLRLQRMEVSECQA